MSEEFEHIVVGAGISGLGMAHRSLRRGISTLVLEGSDRVGGCINSRTFSDGDDFWTETGGHTCYNSYGRLIEILEDLDLTGQLIPKAKLSYSLWRGGKRSSVFSALHPLELIFSLPRLLTSKREGKSVADFYAAGLGRRNYQDLFRPAFRAVICQDPDEFAAELMFRRKPRRKDIARSFTLPGGLSAIPRAIAGQDALQVRMGAKVQKVFAEGEGYRLLLAGGQELKSRYLTFAIPPDAVPALLPQEMSGLRDLIEPIGVAEIETVALRVPVADLPDVPPFAGLISVDDAFYSAVSRDYLADERYRGFAFHFPRGALSADDQRERCGKVLGIDAGRIAEVARVANRLPVLRSGHVERVRQIDAMLAGRNLAMTGNWFLGVSIEDCLNRSRQEFERLFA